jgi:hypothetical protein
MKLMFRELAAGLDDDDDEDEDDEGNTTATGKKSKVLFMSTLCCMYVLLRVHGSMTRHLRR